MVSIVAADVLVLKYQAISIYNTDLTSSIVPVIMKNNYFHWEHTEDLHFILKKK